MAGTKRTKPVKASDSNLDQGSIKKRDLKATGKRKTGREDLSEDGFEPNCEDEDRVSNEDDLDSLDLVDPRFKVRKNVIVYFTLPSGQEEIMIDFEMCFVDKISFQNWKEQGYDLSPSKFESGLKA
jgi:hypothetical protein